MDPLCYFSFASSGPIGIFCQQDLSGLGSGDQWVPFAYSNLQAHCQWNPFVLEPFVFLSRKTCQVWNPRPMGPVCLSWLASALATGPIYLGPISIFPRKTCQVRDPKPTGPICLIGLTSTLAMGPVCSGPVSIFPRKTCQV